MLVALDVSVEQAELQAQEAQAALAKTTLDRLEGLREHRATSQEEVDQARAARDVALAQHGAHPRGHRQEDDPRAVPGAGGHRRRASWPVPDRRHGAHHAPGGGRGRARGLHGGPAGRRGPPGRRLRQVVAGSDSTPVPARIVAVDSRVDPTTRNATVRARIAGSTTPSPGASVRVQVPVGGASKVVAVPVGALRKGPQGDHVFVIAADSTGKTRAHVRPVQSGPVLGDYGADP